MESVCTDPWQNLATEAALFETASLPTLFLWQNADCVVVGKNQRISSECDLHYAKEHGVAVCRRQSGGGAVFQDEGNLNFSFLFFRPAEEALFWEGIVAVFSAFGLQMEKSGRNDLTVNGKKVSGCAYRKQGNKTLLHGTFLIAVNLEKMRKCLTPSAEKRAAHGVASVRARVQNLTESVPSLTVEKWKNTVLEQFCLRFDGTPRALPTGTEPFAAALKRASVPETDESGLVRRFGWGTAEVAGATVYSDAMDAESFRNAAAAWKNGTDKNLQKETEREMYRDLKDWIGGANETV